MTDYKPGTVAEIGWDMTSGRERAIFDGDRWGTESGCTVHRDSVTDVRPLVVLDPDDRESVAALLQAYGDQYTAWTPDLDGSNVDRLQDALRSLTKPPRIPEPKGWGAVVRTDYPNPGSRWVKGDQGWTNLDASGAFLNWSEWECIKGEPTLIREGVES